VLWAILIEGLAAIILLILALVRQEKIMAGTTTGLADLELFTGTTFPAFIAQLGADMATLSANQTALTAAINAAITALQASGSSEDPQVKTAVAQLQGALVTAQANDTSLQSINGNLSKLATSLAAAVPTGSSSISGNVTSGTFVAGETVIQAGSGSVGVLAGVPSAAGPMIVTLNAGSAAPDATDIWTGQTSGATFTPSAAPIATVPPVPAAKGAANPAAASSSTAKKV
jgi:hypothetical protein